MTVIQKLKCLQVRTSLWRWSIGPFSFMVEVQKELIHARSVYKCMSDYILIFFRFL